MALYLFRDWINDLESARPSRIMDQHFGMGLTPSDFLAPMTYPSARNIFRAPSYYRRWNTESGDSGSTMQMDKDKFQVNLDVQQFSPEEINVKVVEDFIVIEGKHEERQDEHGFISRQFVRRYMVPKGYEIKEVKSSLSSDGVLTISAPKSGGIEAQEITIPITQTGGPHKSVEEKNSN